MEATLIDTIPVRCSLGESPVWDWRTKQLFWTDIHERRLYQYDLRSKDLVRFSIAERSTKQLSISRKEKLGSGKLSLKRTMNVRMAQ